MLQSACDNDVAEACHLLASIEIADKEVSGAEPNAQNGLKYMLRACDLKFVKHSCKVF
jgi:hypothetical protein